MTFPRLPSKTVVAVQPLVDEREQIRVGTTQADGVGSGHVEGLHRARPAAVALVVGSQRDLAGDVVRVEPGPVQDATRGRHLEPRRLDVHPSAARR